MSNILFTKIRGRAGDLGKITLNRPQVLNAMTTDMCYSLHLKLKEWAADNTIKAVIIVGEGERAFCAGGDIRHFYEAGSHKINLSQEFFWQEYRMNHAIFHFPKPYIALMQGITMGGGAGISIHGSHRIAAENFRFAMPETGIGLHPDIGAAYFLTRCLNRMGFYLGITGRTIAATDALYVGLIDLIVPFATFEKIIEEIAASDFGEDGFARTTQIIEKFSIPSKDIPPLLEHRAGVEHCFSYKQIEEIISALQKEKTSWADQVIEDLKQRSPTSLKITTKKLWDCLSLSLDDCLKMDFRLTMHILQQHDFYEGIRAAIIDKDRKPQWQPSSLEAVSQNRINNYFQILPGKELTFA